MKKKIVILHGWTYALDKWQEFANLLTRSEFGVDIPEIPGLTQKSNEVWNLERYATWLNEYLKKFDSRVILLGHSNGGRLAIAFAAKYPQKLEKLLLVDSAGIYHNEFPLKVKRIIFEILAKLGKKITNSVFLRRLLYKMAGEKDYEAAPLNMRQTMVNLIQKDLTNEMQQIKLPTQIIWGQNDKITPLSDAYKIKDYIKNSKLSVIPLAGHSPFFTHPKDVIEIIKNDI